jgi:hypothetical protein
MWLLAAQLVVWDAQALVTWTGMHEATEADRTDTWLARPRCWSTLKIRIFGSRRANWPQDSIAAKP